MIAGLDRHPGQWDIDVFLEQNEVDQLEDHQVTGTLIDWDHIAEQGRLELYTVPATESTRDIDLIDTTGFRTENGNYPTMGTATLAVAEPCYDRFTDTGRITVRYDLPGNKTHLYNIGDQATSRTRAAQRADSLQFYEEHVTELDDQFLYEWRQDD